MIGLIALSMLSPYLNISNVLSGSGQLDIHDEIIVHNWYASDSVIQDYANYAYDIWWMDFVKLIECENGRWDPKRVSKTHDHGLCQLHYKYNKKFIDSPDFKDPYKQLDYCYEKYKTNPKLRYWPNRKIKGKKCSDYVDDRFDIMTI